VISIFKKEKTGEVIDEYTQQCPPGLYRVFLTGSTQTAFNVRSEEDVTQEDNIRTIQKQQMLDDIIKRQAGSDFHPIKKFIEEYPEEDVLIIYDYEFQFDKNYYICLSLEMKYFIENVKETILQNGILNSLINCICLSYSYSRH